MPVRMTRVDVSCERNAASIPECPCKETGRRPIALKPASTSTSSIHICRSQRVVHVPPQSKSINPAQAATTSRRKAQNRWCVREKERFDCRVRKRSGYQRIICCRTWPASASPRRYRPVRLNTGNPVRDMHVTLAYYEGRLTTLGDISPATSVFFGRKQECWEPASAEGICRDRRRPV